MRDDLIMALEISFIVKYGPPPLPKPISPIYQELFDYVNSTEYQKLIIADYSKLKP